MGSPESPGQIPHFSIEGHPQQPEVLSNKLILTPMGPGNQRSAVWAETPLSHSTWVADVDFRASGPDRAGGNLNIWFARRGKQEVGTNSIYTAGKFDGLALVVDSHGGSGGMIRGFLNDGTTDYVSQPDVDRLAFGQCNYYYRNLGRPSQIKLRQTANNFKVEVDGHHCFETDKVTLPPGYYFGLTAATPETPDSFEIFKFVVMSETTAQGDQGNSNEGAPAQHQDYHYDGGDHSNSQFENAIPDKSADAFSTSKEQFRDLHDRLQESTHQISQVYTAVAKHHQMDEARHNEMRSAIDALRQDLGSLHQIAELQNKISALESEIRSMHQDMRQKIAAHGESFEANLRQHHSSLSRAMLESFPKGRTIIGFFVVVQVATVAIYIGYKRRRANNPRKYL